MDAKQTMETEKIDKSQVEFSVATREILTQNLSNTRSAITEIRQNLETIDAGRRRAEVKVKELTAELELERSERQRAQRDRTALAEKFDLLEKNLAVATVNSEELDKTRKRLADIAKEKDEFQQALLGAEQQMTALKTKVEEVSGATGQYDKRIAELEGEVQTARNTAEGTVTTLKGELDAERKKATLFEERLATKLAEAQKQTEELEAAKAAFDHLAEELKTAKTEKNEETDKIKSEIETVRVEMEDSERKVIELQAQLEAVNQSREVANLDLMIARKAIEELRAGSA